MLKKLTLSILFVFALLFAVQTPAICAKKKKADSGIEKTENKKTANDKGQTEEAAADKKAQGNKKDISTQPKKKEPIIHSIWKLYLSGGPFMWPILIMTALGLGFIIERFIYFALSRIGSREFINKLDMAVLNEDLSKVEALCKDKKNDNKISQIILKGLELKELGYERVEKTLSVSASVEVSKMERGLNVLLAVGNIVPMLGFLGTVTGMVTAFNDIAAADQVSAKIVAGGIQQALLTTAAGLIAAIPTLLFYNYFIHRIEGFIGNVERLASDLVKKMIREKTA